MKITRKREADALAIGSSRGQGRMSRLADTTWGVYANGRRIGIFESNRYQHSTAAEDGRNYVIRGNWRSVIAKLADKVGTKCFPT